MNHNIFLRAIAISLVSNNGKFSYFQTGEMCSKVLSYQIKRWLDKNWNEQEELEKYITKLNIDWSKGWLMIDDTVVEKTFSKTNECVYWQYSSKNADFITGISLTVGWDGLFLVQKIAPNKLITMTNALYFIYQIR